MRVVAAPRWKYSGGRSATRRVRRNLRRDLTRVDEGQPFQPTPRRCVTLNFQYRSGCEALSVRQFARLCRRATGDHLRHAWARPYAKHASRFSRVEYVPVLVLRGKAAGSSRLQLRVGRRRTVGNQGADYQLHGVAAGTALHQPGSLGACGTLLSYHPGRFFSRMRSPSHLLNSILSCTAV